MAGRRIHPAARIDGRVRSWLPVLFGRSRCVQEVRVDRRAARRGARLAQEAAPTPTPNAVAAARAHADAVLDKSEARPFFVNVTADDTPTVRHVASEMTCEFIGGDDRDTIRFYGSVENGPVRGDDVSCGTWIGRTYVTLFATRYPQRYSQEQLFEDAIRQLVRNWPSATAYEGPLEILTREGQESPLLAAFDVELEGRPSRSLILVRNLGEWSFKARATGPGTDDTVAEFGSMAFALAIPDGTPVR